MTQLVHIIAEQIVQDAVQLRLIAQSLTLPFDLYLEVVNICGFVNGITQFDAAALPGLHLGGQIAQKPLRSFPQRGHHMAQGLQQLGLIAPGWCRQLLRYQADELHKIFHIVLQKNRELRGLGERPLHGAQLDPHVHVQEQKKTFRQHRAEIALLEAPLAVVKLNRQGNLVNFQPPLYGDFASNPFTARQQRTEPVKFPVDPLEPGGGKRLPAPAQKIRQVKAQAFIEVHQFVGDMDPAPGLEQRPGSGSENAAANQDEIGIKVSHLRA